jgi:D-glycero-alpha-D-manno-heptose 1-phosphate guanylyltransferase
MNMKMAPSEMIILAGGFGTRLQSVVSDVPKPMAPVDGRPFLAYLLDYWIGQGIQHFVISTGYLANVIMLYFGEFYRSARITYVHENSPLGTGGALRLILNALTWEAEQVLMANGDTWFPVQLDQFCASSSRCDSIINVALKRLEKNDRYAGVKVSAEGKITSFGERNNGTSYINAGCYLMNVSDTKSALLCMPNAFSLENDFLIPLALQGRVGACIQDQPFLDIGIPDDYHRAFNFLR